MKILNSVQGNPSSDLILPGEVHGLVKPVTRRMVLSKGAAIGAALAVPVIWVPSEAHAASRFHNFLGLNREIAFDWSVRTRVRINTDQGGNYLAVSSRARDGTRTCSIYKNEDQSTVLIMSFHDNHSRRLIELEVNPGNFLNPNTETVMQSNQQLAPWLGWRIFKKANDATEYINYFAWDAIRKVYKEHISIYRPPGASDPTARARLRFDAFNGKLQFAANGFGAATNYLVSGTATIAAAWYGMNSMPIGVVTVGTLLGVAMVGKGGYDGLKTVQAHSLNLYNMIGSWGVTHTTTPPADRVPGWNV